MITLFDPNTDIDLGTPARDSQVQVTLNIDGRSISVPEGTSVMRAAALLGTTIPKLCATDSLEAFGSCRMCLVEIDGMRGYPASCTTPVSEGMSVHTQTPKLATLRRNVMELYISDHPLDCLTCSANGNCELQTVAGQVGLREVRYGYEGDNHLADVKDTSNPYFDYDPSKCIVCNRCVRACEETQGTFALTITGRGFESRVAAAGGDNFLDSECVSCGACVQACPTATLMEKSVVELGQPERSVITTCAYCGVGCSFRAEMKGDQLVRMVPDKNGQANHGHSCVKGRFAWGYATHPDRITKPMIRKHINDPWQEVSWDEAVTYAASEFRRLQQKYGRDSIGGITSSRCTNEETYLVQKLVRAAFGNNNVDTCARVCHSPTGYGLKQTLGESAGTQSFDSVMQADVILVMGANPSDAHPVFASQLKRRLREGARLIVIDPRRIDLVDSVHARAELHLALRPGTNVAMLNALAHVIVTEGLLNQAFIDARCEGSDFAHWSEFVSRAENSPEVLGAICGVDRCRHPRRRPSVCHRRQCRDLLRPGRHRAQPGQHRGHGHRQPGHGHWQHRPRRRGREPAAWAEQRSGLLRHGLLPPRAAWLPPHLQRGGTGAVRTGLECHPATRPGPAHSQHVRSRPQRQLQGPVLPGRGHRPERPEYPARHRSPVRHGMRRGAGHFPQRNRQVRPRVPAGLLVPGKRRHLHQRRAAHLPGAQGHGPSGRQGRLGRHRGPGQRAGLPDELHSTRQKSWMKSPA